MTDPSGTYRAPDVPGISLGEYDVPLDGIDANGAMYVWFSTDRMTRSVLARSNDDGRTFAFVHDVSALHFVNVSAVRAGDDVLLFGSGAFRTSEVYLARVPAASIEDRSSYRFFAGAAWSADEAVAAPLFGPACVGELSASFVPALDAYVVMHACGEPRGIQVRVARAATGPWSDAVTVFEPWADGGYCHFMHTSYAFETCDAVQDPGRDTDWGGEYAPYLVEPLVQSLGAHAAALYFTMSTWNPYTTVLMRTELSWH
jgi:hypothetical protein